jgi:hypothetical protein
VTQEHLIAVLTAAATLLGGSTFVGFNKAGEEGVLKDVLRDALTSQALMAQDAYHRGFESGLEHCDG